MLQLPEDGRKYMHYTLSFLCWLWNVISAIVASCSDLAAGNVHTVIMNGVNPVYTLPEGKAFAENLKKAKLSVAFSLREDETAKASGIAIGIPHYLESWNDLSPVKGSYALVQPAIRTIFPATKQFQETLLSWLGNGTGYYNYLRANSAAYTTGSSWNQTVHDGVHGTPVMGLSSAGGNWAAAASALAAAKKPADFELVLYTKTGLGDGQQANNPWLQEFPDPITRVSWDNYVTMSAADAKKLDVKNWNVANGALNGDYISITINGKKLDKVPVLIQPGQAVGTIGLSMGYGKTASLKEEMKVGVNAYTLYNGFNDVQSAKITKVDGEHEFACVQLQRTLMGRG
ncbi:MAG: quinol:cytochrome C oxidoreductase, partial [Sphingobacteriales bacterium]